MFKLNKIKVKGVSVFDNPIDLEFVTTNNLDDLLEDGKSTILKSIISVLFLEDSVIDNNILKTYNYDGDSFIELELMINDNNLILKKDLNTNKISYNNKNLFNLYKKYKNYLIQNIYINETNINEIKPIKTLVEEIKLSFVVENMKINNIQEVMDIKNLLDLEEFTSKEEFYQKLDSFELKILDEIKILEENLVDIENKEKRILEINTELTNIEKMDIEKEKEKINQSLKVLREQINDKKGFLSENRIYTFKEMKDFIHSMNEYTLFNKENLNKIVSFFNSIDKILESYPKLDVAFINEFSNDKLAVSIFSQLYKIDETSEDEDEFLDKFRSIFKPHKDNVIMNKAFSIFGNDFEVIMIIVNKIEELKELKLWDKITKFFKSENLEVIYENKNKLLDYIKNIIFYLQNNELVLDKNIQKYIDKMNSEIVDYNEEEFKNNVFDLNKLFVELDKLLNDEKNNNIKAIEEVELKDELLSIKNDINDISINLNLNDEIKISDLIQNKKAEFKEIQKTRDNYTNIIEELFENKQKNELEKARVLIGLEENIEDIFKRYLGVLTNKEVEIEDGELLLNKIPIGISKSEEKLLYKLVYIYIYNQYLNKNVETSLLLIDNLLSYVKNKNFDFDLIIKTISEISDEKLQLITHY